MKTKSRVCLVLANWNWKRFMDQVIKSVAGQTFSDWEQRNLLEPLVRYRVWQGSTTTVLVWEAARLAPQTRLPAIGDCGFEVLTPVQACFTLASSAALLPTSLERGVFHLGLNCFKPRSASLSFPRRIGSRMMTL